MITSEDVRYVLARDTSVPTGTAAVLADADIDTHIGSASAEVAARVSLRYTIPADPSLLPLLLRDITVDIAAYLATLQYRQGKDLSDSDPVVLRYRRAQELLAGIAAGKISLPITDDGDGDPTSGAGESAVKPAINPYVGNLFAMSDVGLGYGPSSRAGWF